jgi:hypothetical protein
MSKTFEIRDSSKAADDSQTQRGSKSVDDDDLAGCPQERDPAFLKSIEKARHQIAAGNTISHDAL